jgi:uncharacterized metal-binding protein YceD (DUF177 family)
MFYSADSLIFRLRGIREGEHPFACSITPADLAIAEATGPISVVGTLDATESYLFRAKIKGTLHHTCDRCAEEFEANYEVPVTAIYTPGQEGDELDDREYVHTFQEPELFEVDLTEDVHDALLLAVPMKKLHSPDCKGIAQVAVTTPAFDERFSALGSLYERLRSEEDPE